MVGVLEPIVEDENPDLLETPHEGQQPGGPNWF
jgi:hypothetical protein